MTSRPVTPGPITYVKVACHCGLNEFRAGFLTDQLPISNDLCHCNACRHSSGQMAVYHVSVASLICSDTDEAFHVDGDGCKSPGGDGDLIAYRTSDDAVRYFCSICSAQLLFHYLGKPKEGEGSEKGKREGGFWCVAAGALERTEGIVKVGYHIWVEDTLDGGLAEHFRTVDGVDLPRYRGGAKTEQLPLGWHDLTPSSKSLNGSDDALYFACHCRTLQFKVTRPNAQSYLPHSAFPDLMHPYDTTHLAKVRNSGDVKWWLRPLEAEHPAKYFSGHCACEYCRLTSGFEIQSWAYVPRGNIIVESTGKSLALQEAQKDEVEEVKEALERLGMRDDDLTPKAEEATMEDRTKGLRQYISGPGRYRESCQNCGATAFAWQAGRPDLICVAVALVDEAQAGSRAETWFDWCLTRVSFMEQALSPKTVEGMVVSMKAVELEGREEQKIPLEEAKGLNGSAVPLSTFTVKGKDTVQEVVALVDELTA
ncbi:hypothetical protein D9611_011934 [Ephemerocybe angulata]|uniref:CENP-V/GFA domain-containing protein n=1 Tax=Ephemerocybe angulata TaxID=980116 RepID=A0A8H5C4I0_9AGAR|nr:hypothetical protein D9611_011934 [Tulosesus angulatus]